MPILSVHNLTKSFSERLLFEDVSFEVEKGDKVGFIGANGVGKTTLFRIINGEISADSGTVTTSSGIRVGYMQQHACNRPDRSVYDEVLSEFDYLSELERQIDEQNRLVNIDPTQKNIELQTSLIERFESLGGLTYKARVSSGLAGFGFPEKMFSMPTGKLSGGQRSKLSLLKLLLSRSDFLLLDEPTNHLDLTAVAWLENFIRDFRGSMLIISHDRYFLDRVTNKTVELEHTHTMTYSGNYTEFKRKKHAYTDALRNKYENDLKEIKRIEGIVEQQKRWGRERNIIAAGSRQKQADKIKAQLVRPESELESIHIHFKPKRDSGNDVLIAENLSKGFGDRKLFSNLNFHIRKGERVFIIGENGCGKTTLFNILMSKLAADSGFVEFGAQVDIGYFDQMQSTLDLRKTALDEVWDAFPELGETKARTCLGSFLIKGDDVFKKLEQMSGGERARVSILKLVLGGANLLLLDEPTNHLDAASREQLEKTLEGYDGTMLIISHDRYFINRLATRILCLENGGFTEYLGDYDYYLEKSKQPKVEAKTEKTEKAPNDYILEKQRRAAERKRENDLRKLEEKIEQLEKETENLSEQLSDGEVSSDYEKVLELSAQLEEKQKELEEAFEEWEKLGSEN